MITTGFKEAEIIINKTKLNNAQSMTLRVALENLAMSLSQDGLGKDKKGLKMTRAYLNRINEIRAIIFKRIKP